jgi:hypothetical protein
MTVASRRGHPLLWAAAMCGLWCHMYRLYRRSIAHVTPCRCSVYTVRCIDTASHCVKTASGVWRQVTYTITWAVITVHPCLKSLSTTFEGICNLRDYVHKHRKQCFVFIPSYNLIGHKGKLPANGNMSAIRLWFLKQYGDYRVFWAHLHNCPMWGTVYYDIKDESTVVTKKNTNDIFDVTFKHDAR